MRLAFRAAALAVVVALTAFVVVFRPGAEPVAEAAQPALDADLALVPADAVGFVHIRAADLWKHELLAGFRNTFEKAGPKALAALDAQFVPKISTFERLTAFVLLEANRPEPLPYVVLRFGADFNPEEVANAYLPLAEKKLVGGKPVYRNEQADFELYFPDKRHIVVAPPGALTVYLKHEPAKTGPLAQGLKLAASGKPVVAALNVTALNDAPEPIQRLLFNNLPPGVQPLLKTELVTLSLDLSAGAKLELVATYRSDADAQAAEKAIQSLAALSRKELDRIKADIEKKLLDPKVKTPRPFDHLPDAVFDVFLLGAINQTDELLANTGALIKRDGLQLSASVTLPKELVAGASHLASVGAALLMPSVYQVRVSAARLKSQNNLKQIGLALHNYHDAYGHFPQDIVDKDGKPLLSWRVAILPYIEQDALYQKFKLDEPWDSENNKKWSEVAIKVYMSPLASPTTPPGMTHYKAFVGKGTVFERGKPIKITDIADGSSNTFLVAEAGDPIPWAKPDDIPYDPKKPFAKPFLPGVADYVNVLFGDGSVRTINMTKVSERTLRNLIERNDGNAIGDDFFDK